jgi:DNA-binding MarR family transcriptional regulator
MKTTLTEHAILEYLLDGPASFNSIALRLHLRPDTLNRVLEKLRERGLVEWVDAGNETKVGIVRE